MNSAELKKLPPLLSDEAAERFTEEADLSEYDLSGFHPVQFEFQPKDARLELRIPREQLEALKSAAKRLGVPPTRLVRQFIEDGMRHLKA